MRKSLLAVFLAAAAGFLPGGSWAQVLQGDRGPTPALTLNVRSLDFDLWCQQTQRYAADRCAARRPEDVKAFEDYRATVERYEFDYLRQQDRVQQVRARINRDPNQTVSGKQDGLP
jgi:hypothetical protein